jgi:hypothetical protein
MEQSLENIFFEFWYFVSSLYIYVFNEEYIKKDTQLLENSCFVLIINRKIVDS